MYDVLLNCFVRYGPTARENIDKLLLGSSQDHVSGMLKCVCFVLELNIEIKSQRYHDSIQAPSCFCLQHRS